MPKDIDDDYFYGTGTINEYLEDFQVYEKNGELHLHDTRTDDVVKVSEDGSLQTEESRSKHDVSGTTVDVREFGADPSGTDPSDQAFSDAVAAANPGDTVVFRDGEFLLDQDHEIQKPLTVKGDGAKIRRESSSGSGAIGFYGGGRTGTTTGISQTVTRGSTEIPVTDASLFSESDRVFIREQAYEKTASHYAFQFAEVVDVDTTNDVLHISNGVAFDFDTNSEVDKVDLLRGARIEGLEFEAPEDVDGASVMWAEWCENPVMSDLHVRGTRLYSYKMFECWQPVIRDCVSMSTHTNDGGQREPFSFARCCDGVMRSCRSYDHRRGFEWTLQTHSCGIIDPVAERCRTGLGDHTPGGGVDNYVIGGRISQHPNLGTASCLSVKSDNFRAVGTVLKASERAISLSDCDNALFDGVRIEAVEGADSDGQAIIMTGDVGSATFDNLEYHDPYGVFSGGSPYGSILVQTSTEVNSLDIDFNECDVDTASALIRVHENTPAVDKMSVSGRIEGTSNVSDVMDTSGATVNYLDWSADVYGAQRLLHQAQSNVARFHDCNVQTSDNGIWIHEGSVDRLWISECDVDAGADDVRFESNLDSLGDVWLINNGIETFTEDTTPTNKVQSGNIPLDMA